MADSKILGAGKDASTRDQLQIIMWALQIESQTNAWFRKPWEYTSSDWPETDQWEAAFHIPLELTAK